MAKLKEKVYREVDIALWKDCEDKFKNKFSSKLTWLQIHENHACSWNRGVWMPHLKVFFYDMADNEKQISNCRENAAMEHYDELQFHLCSKINWKQRNTFY